MCIRDRNSTDWKSGECTDTHVSSQSFVKGFTVKQHRLEKQKTHRHSCVIAILCERIYCETAQTGKAENAQTLMCHRDPLERIYCGTEQVGEVENAQTLDVSSQATRKVLMWNNTDWISRECTDTWCVTAIL